MKFTSQATRSVSGGQVFTGTSVLGPVPPRNSVESWEINAGLIDIFPQLAPEANLYTEYTFKRLIFRYIPSVGATTQGRLVFVFNRNVQSTPPISFTQAASYEGTTACNVWEEMVFSAQVGEKKFVRNAAYPAGSDPKTYDAGRFTVLLENAVDSDPTFEMGMLLIDYEVYCSNRQLSPPLGAEILLPQALIPVHGISTDLLQGIMTTYFQLPVLNPIMQVQLDTGVGATAYLGIPPGLWWLTFTGRAIDGSSAMSSNLNWTIVGNGDGAYAEQIGSPTTVTGGFIDQDEYFEFNALIFIPEAATGDLEQSPNSVYLEWSANMIAGWVSGTPSIALQHTLLRMPDSAFTLFESPPITIETAGPQMRRHRIRYGALHRKREKPKPLDVFGKEHDRDVVKLGLGKLPSGCDRTCKCKVHN